MTRLIPLATALALLLWLPAPASAAPCGSITSVGCCDGSTVKYCASGTLKTKDCTKDSYGPACGWVTKFKGYGCNKTATTDPSGTYPRTCGSSTSDAGVPAKDSGTSSCGNITKQGCCVGTNTVKYCSNGSVKTKDCTKDSYGPACGWVTKFNGYGCNKTATSDPNGTYPRTCGAPVADGGTTTADSGTTSNCGDVTKQGCCDGSKVKYCSSGKLQTKDCTSDKNGPACGWVTAFNGYGCNKTATVDPTGKYLRSCNAATDAGSSAKDQGGSTTADQGSTTQQDKGSSAADAGVTKKDSGSSKPFESEDDGCSVAASGSRGSLPSAGLPLVLLLAGLLLRARRR